MAKSIKKTESVSTGKVEEKVTETLNEMTKATEKAIEEAVEETQAPVVTEEETPVLTEEPTTETVEDETPVLTEEPTTETVEDETVEDETVEDETVEDETQAPDATEEVEELVESDVLEKIKTLIKNENNFNYVSFGRHLQNGIDGTSLKAFYEEFAKSGMLSSKNHYELLKYLKMYFNETVAAE